MTPVRTERAAGQITGWISVQTGLPPDRIPPDAELIGSGLLDSFALISLSALVEELLDRPLTEDELSDLDAFRSVNTILRTFFSV